MEAVQQSDQCKRPSSQFLTKEEIRAYSKISNIRFLTAVLREILTVAVTVWVSETYWNPVIYLIAVIVIGTRLQGFAVLMHDACHYRALSNRRWNDIMGELISLVLPVSMQGFRNNHLAHHRELNSHQDPDWLRIQIPDYAFPKTRAQIWATLAKYAFALTIWRDSIQVRKEKLINDVPLSLKRRRILFYISLLALSIVLGFWKLLILYWIIPYFTVFNLSLYIRAVAEHFTPTGEYSILHETRTIVAPLWELWLIAPNGINYHTEHHLYPSVPYYRLPALHKYLMSNPSYRKEAHVTHRYSGLFRECAKD